MKKGCKMAINIDEKNEKIVRETAERVGFVLIETLRLKTGRDHFNRKNGLTDKERSEPVLIFVKR